MQTFPATGGYGGSQNDWLHEVVRRRSGKPAILKLRAGEHTVVLTNVDGHGMNLDYIALVPAD